MAGKRNRRTFLQQATLLGASGGYFLGAAAARAADSPNERLNIAAIGATGRAGADIAGVATQNIIAISDIDSQLLEKGAAKYPKARKYADFRVMLEKEAPRVDAVVVGTPDHTHAPASAMALRMGKPVYCEKPLTHTIYEARVLTELAKKANVPTQMGNQIHSLENYRQVVELVQSGAIGPVPEVHVWAGARYSGAKFNEAPKPPHVNWDLWLGPAVERPYCKGIHPFHWRRFWDYGTGALGDFGCHYMDLAHWALDLKYPQRVAAHGPAFDPVSTPEWLIAHYEYPARGEKPPVKLVWYDSGRRPEILKSLRDKNGKPLNFGSGQLFLGEDLWVLSNYGRHHVISPKTKQVIDHQPAEKTIPRSIGHHAEWLHAIKTGGRSTCDFSYTGPLTEAVMLGTVAYRSGKTLEWDAEKLKVRNAPDAQKWVHKEYRKGWKL